MLSQNNLLSNIYQVSARVDDVTIDGIDLTNSEDFTLFAVDALNLTVSNLTATNSTNGIFIFVRIDGVDGGQVSEGGFADLHWPYLQIFWCGRETLQIVAGVLRTARRPVLGAMVKRLHWPTSCR